jgi:hypothetical protein
MSEDGLASTSGSSKLGSSKVGSTRFGSEWAYADSCYPDGPFRGLEQLPLMFCFRII